MTHRAILSILFLFSGVGFFSQNGIVKGTITDAVTGEPLFGASIIYAPGKGVTSDFDGKYELKVPYGEYELTYSFVQMKTVTKQATVNGNPTTFDIKMESKIMRAIEITADIAKERETPVAFTNISAAKLDEELASQDLPMVLNSTPSVYATQQGGGDGDARITIRGFSQRNLAVMVDGVPVNDMENGWVYWSNWFGLDAVTSQIQVQRGLGVSKLAVPSVGGTMNIFTKGIDAKPEIKVKAEYGSNNFWRQSVGLTTGKLKGDWGFTGAFSIKRGEGWADQNYTEGMFFYGKLEKKIKNHLISLSAFAAPQSHGQRSFKRPISFYDTTKAKDLGVSSEAIKFYDNSFGSNRGFQHNEFWGRYTNSEGQSVLLHEKENYYNKPQITLKDFWQVNDKFYISNVAYLSIGNGGGTGITGRPGNDPDGQLNAQFIYDGNTNGDFGPPIDPQYSATELKGSAFKRSSVNNHFWYGLLSTGTYVKNENLTISGGIDLRDYRGTHFREVYDLVGADYIIDNSNANTNDLVKRVGDKISYYDEGQVRWGGLFAQAEYKKDLWSAFVSASGSASGYNGVDYFRAKTLNVGDTTLEIGYEDTVMYKGESFDRNSDGLETYETGWKVIPGYTIKAGANYIINESSNIFGNLGYLNNAPKFANVIDQQNEFVKNVKNEKVRAIELGYSYKKKKLAFGVNSYYTNWLDRPYSLRRTGADAETFTANITMNAVHAGVEFEAAYDLLSNLTIEGIVSLGDWTWQSKKDSVVFLDDQGNAIQDNSGNIQVASFDARGVHVGDAAQTQLGAKIRWNFTRRSYIKAQYTWFDRYYANFEPANLNGENAGRESWQIPSYGLMDVHMGTTFKFQGVPLSIRMSILNALDSEYISDAQNNDQFSGQSYNNFDAQSATVFFGQGRRYNFSIQAKF